MGDPQGAWAFRTDSGEPYQLLGFVFFVGSGRVNVIGVEAPVDGSAERIESPAEDIVSTDDTLRLTFGPGPISFVATCTAPDALTVRLSVPRGSEIVNATATMRREESGGGLR
jgi:hypothetical protein